VPARDRSVALPLIVPERGGRAADESVAHSESRKRAALRDEEGARPRRWPGGCFRSLHAGAETPRYAGAGVRISAW
jgi:hypothetical protein